MHARTHSAHRRARTHTAVHVLRRPRSAARGCRHGARGGSLLVFNFVMRGPTAQKTDRVASTGARHSICSQHYKYLLVGYVHIQYLPKASLSAVLVLFGLAQVQSVLQRTLLVIAIKYAPSQDWSVPSPYRTRATLLGPERLLLPPQQHHIFSGWPIPSFRARLGCCSYSRG